MYYFCLWKLCCITLDFSTVKVILFLEISKKTVSFFYHCELFRLKQKFHMCKKQEPWADYVGFDLFGFAYNCKYPPDMSRYGRDYDGYATPNQGTFFYDFCILQYGVVFYHKNTPYKAEFTNDGPIVRNYGTGEIQGPFEDAVNLIEEAIINGQKLLHVMEELEDIDLH